MVWACSAIRSAVRLEVENRTAPGERTQFVTNRGEVVAFLVPRPRMEALLEQMEILANPAAMKAIQRARRGEAKDHPLSALDED